MQLDYGNRTYKGLSYSRLSDFHSCARLYELQYVLGLATRVDSNTFSYGHAVAAGVQSILQGESLELALFHCMAFWSVDIDDYGTAKELKAKKIFGYAIQAVEIFYNQYNDSSTEIYQRLAGLEVAVFNQNSGIARKAVELTFKIKLVDDFEYEGHIDVVMYCPRRNKFFVLELKTTSFNNPSPAQYQNSNQALGYSIVIDAASESYKNIDSSFDVIYLIYSSTKQEYTIYNFTKNYAQRANWLNSLIFDISYLSMLMESGVQFPTNGASCFNFFTPCHWIDKCTKDNSVLIEYAPKVKEKEQFKELASYDLEFTLEYLLEVQQRNIDKGEVIPVSDVTHLIELN
jgi:hypothetical protein